MKNNIRNIFILFTIGTIVFLVGNINSGGLEFSSIKSMLTNFGFYQLYSFVLGLGNMTFLGYLEKRQWNTYDSIKRIVIGLSGSLIITLFLMFILRMLISLLYNGISFETFISNEKLAYYNFGLWITLTITTVFYIIYFIIYFINKKQKKKVKESQIVAKTASAKFDALKNQLDPHFLFNSLNVLTSLIEENPESAQKFTTSLSKVYRYVLEQKNKDLVSVDEELQFARTYMSLLKMRFEDSIIFEIPEKSLDPESKVVPLSLQLLLENAVKHNMVTSSKPLRIRIYEYGGGLIVENNLQPKKIIKKSSGVGLNNIIQRYALLTTKKVNINQQANRFAVAIPLLTKNVSIMKTLPQSSSGDSYMRAKKHVEELKEFYYSLTSYCIVIPFLAFINYSTFWGVKWFIFPMIGWGAGLAFQAYGVYVKNGFLGQNWEERKIQEYMEEQNRKGR